MIPDVTVLGQVAEVLGIASGIMLFAGAILAACLKRYDLVKIMVSIGIVGTLVGLAAPGLMDMAGTSDVAIFMTIFTFIFYLAVLLLPTFLALKANVSKKWLIIGINLANFLIPASGLVAFYLVLKELASTDSSSNSLQ